MTTQETTALVAALVGLFGALQAWLTYKAVNHDQKLDGLMAPRIAAGAAAVQAATTAAAAAQPALDSAAARAAHAAALRTELAALETTP